MGRLEVTHCHCLRRIVGVKLTDCHRLETVHEQCGIKVSCGRWPRGTTELRLGHRNIKQEDCSGAYIAAIRGATRKRSKQRQRNMPRAGRPGGDAIKNLAPLEFKKPQQVGCMTRSCARRVRRG
eukprot:363288-Chlamydomonas_euryale.AAC.10